ncbi:DNA topoisomerase IV [Cyclobacterium jeungdonense]|uniref:DNA topoisomerase IV n=1 Tax=Cyclobacterium jeungdonense TaxID=708087 RepID=A0ABT8C7E0_9BACT|nr:DNA topoisomerase IV [Cyclobacterium jeungdonense]MDN3688430.1 DNA topoisomerase IV [Cyclobacterium jeungdonense]
MYTRFAKVFYFLSIGLFLFLLLYAYAGLPEFATYASSESGMPKKQVSKEVFFYSAIALFLVYNVLLIVPAKLMEMKLNASLNRLFPVGDVYRDKMLAWMYSFIAVLNLATAVLVFYIYSISNQNGIGSSEYNFFFYLAPVLMLVWVLGLFYLISGKIKQVKSGTILN